MNIRFVVGSKNKAKVDAVAEILTEYPHLAKAEVSGEKTDSGVANQPLTLNEAVTGAMNRARSAFVNCEYGVGIESGLMSVAHTKSGYLDVCAAAIYDGTEFYLGLSSAWEFPEKNIIYSMVNEELDMSQAVSKAGLIPNLKNLCIII